MGQFPGIGSDTSPGRPAFPCPAPKGRVDSRPYPHHPMCHTVFCLDMASRNCIQFLHRAARGPGVVHIAAWEKRMRLLDVPAESRAEVVLLQFVPDSAPSGYTCPCYHLSITIDPHNQDIVIISMGIVPYGFVIRIEQKQGRHLCLSRTRPIRNTALHGGSDQTFRKDQ